jgi:16S rRNA (guanine527-N7)-methyltransferase
MKDRIARGLDSLGLTGRVPEESASLLAEYGRLLVEKNQVMNLTAITDPEQVADLHMLDCAALLTRVDLSNRTLIDVGTGAGFPGMVLKILCPSLEITLLDSLQKRLDWLDEVISTLGLTGIRTVHGRGEELSHDPAFRQAFDFASARAVAELRTLSELCLPYVRPGGKFLAMKSVASDEELAAAAAAIRKLGGGEVTAFDYTIPATQVAHRLLVIPKTGGTPKEFPRRWAKMQKSPL